jgi:hypothetical protein
VVVHFKTIILAPGEIARPSEGNWIRENLSKTWVTAKPNFRLQFNYHLTLLPSIIK